MTVWEWLTDPAMWIGPAGIRARVVEQVLMTVAAVGLAALIALPAGIAAGHTRRFGSLVTNVANLGRAIPTFALLLLFASISAIGVGFLAALLALVLFAVPPIVVNAYTGVRSVDPAVRDAGCGMGMDSRSLLWTVEIPMASGLLAAGLRTALVQTAATATLAAFVGGGGLGRFILDGFGRQDTAMVFGGVILVAALVGILELIMAGAQRLLTPIGVRQAYRVA